MQADWVAFHDLDEIRGGPPKLTPARAVRPSDMFMLIASRQAVTVVPTVDAAILLAVLRGIVAIPLRDAPPSLFTIVWRNDNHSPLVRAITKIAATLGDGDAMNHDGAAPEAPKRNSRQRAVKA